MIVFMSKDKQSINLFFSKVHLVIITLTPVLNVYSQYILYGSMEQWQTTVWDTTILKSSIAF